MTTTIIIGAGIIGLHTANVLYEKNHEVYVLDQAPFLGEHCSGRNSGVIHAGIYYKPGSLKEQLCIEGNRLTYEWLKKLNVDHNPCGKLVVPLPGQENNLEPFFDRIRQLPIPTPTIDSNAILVPSTGIMDAAGYVKALATYLEAKGVTIILNCKVTGVSNTEIETSRGPIPYDLAINCAGLWCDDIAKMTGITNYTIRPCRGDYFSVNKKLFDRPIYHLPLKGSRGLGLHVTPTFDGQTLIGPNDFFIEEKADYKHRSDEKDFADSLDYYLKWIASPNGGEADTSVQRVTGEGGLMIGQSGNRPKLFKSNSDTVSPPLPDPLPKIARELVPVEDFAFLKHKNWIHCLGIESPGLTAAPAVARHVGTLL